MYGRRGLGGLKRLGLGQADTTSTTVLNYPGMPIDQNAMIATPLTANQLAALSAANAAFFNQPVSGTAASWWSQNSGIVTVTAGALILLTVLRGGRR